MAASFSITLGRPLGAALLLAGLVVGALAAIGASWADLSALGEERGAKADLLERNVAASRRGARPEAAAALADPFVAAETATLAAAKVDADLRSRAEAAGLALLSSRADAKPDDGAAKTALGTRIEVQATMEGQNPSVQALLLALERGTPTILVDDLSLEPAEVDQANAGDPQAPKLHMSLTLSAYWRPSKP